MTTEVDIVGKDNENRYLNRVEIGGIYLSNPDLLPFLIKLKNSNVKTVFRVSQEQFMESNPLLRGITDAELVSEIEVNSLDMNDMNFIQEISNFPNLVLRLE